MAAALAASVCGLLLLVPLSVVVARHASATAQIHQLNDQVTAELESLELTEPYLRRVEALLDELQVRDKDSSDKARRRLYDRFAETIRSEIRQPKLDAPDIQRIQAAIELLAARQPEVSDPLQSALEKRQSQFQTVVHLAAPFDKLNQVFDEPTPQPRADRTAMDRTATAATTNRVVTNLPSDGFVQIEATFDAAWEQHAQVGVSLIHPGDVQNVGYDFLLSSKSAGRRAAAEKDEPPAVANPDEESRAIESVEDRGECVADDPAQRSSASPTRV